MNTGLKIEIFVSNKLFLTNLFVDVSKKVDKRREPNGCHGCNARDYGCLLEADNENDKTDEYGIHVEHHTSRDCHPGDGRERRRNIVEPTIDPLILCD